MQDTNWETINGEIAGRIEFLNYANQINVLDGLLHFLIAHRGPTGNGNPPMPDEAALRELHHAGTLFLLAKPGRYRDLDVHVSKEDGEVVYKAPPWQQVDGLIQMFFRQLSSLWTSGDALDVAAYALWKINWIHPFRNGNGRTARAFAYACLNLRLGVILPGTVTVIDLVMAKRDRYESAIRTADKSFKEKQMPDLSEMKAFLDECLQKQISSIEVPVQNVPKSTG